MKPMPSSHPELSPLLVVGAHPDDIEFGVGGVIAAETRRGRPVHLVVGSRGESGTNGTGAERTREAEAAAAILGATLEFVDLGGDANIENTRAGARLLADIIRRVKPETVFTLSLPENQHPDHAAVGRMTRDAARLARYGGVAELKAQPRHAIRQLFYYAVAPDAAPRDVQPVLYSLAEADVAVWRQAMAAHASQMRTRDYATLQITRASLLGQNAGAAHAIALYPNEPLIVEALAELGPGSRFY